MKTESLRRTFTGKELSECFAVHPTMFSDLKSKHLIGFVSWVTDNTNILEAFHYNAKMLRIHGNQKTYSAYCIREKVRWDNWLNPRATKFGISNNHTPFLARLIMKLDPELDGMFKLNNTCVLR